MYQVIPKDVLTIEEAVEPEVATCKMFVTEEICDVERKRVSADIFGTKWNWTFATEHVIVNGSLSIS